MERLALESGVLMAVDGRVRQGTLLHTRKSASLAKAHYVSMAIAEQQRLRQLFQSHEYLAVCARRLSHTTSFAKSR